MQSLSPCDRVFAIQELLEAIAVHLDLDDPSCSRLLACVCLRWYRYFEPYIWTRTSLQTRNKRSTEDFQRHGALVQKLTCEQVDRSVLKIISLYGVRLDTLHLVLDHSSALVTHVQLEEALQSVQVHLTTVTIKLDLSVHNVSILSALFWLPNLAALGIQVFGRVNLEALYVLIGACCPALRSLDLDHWIPSAPRALSNRLMSFVQKALASGDSLSSTTSQETDETDISTPSRNETSLAILPSLRLPSLTLEFMEYTSIRRLELRGLSKDVPLYVEVIKSCSLLEDLHLRDEATTLLHGTWIEIAVKCPHLRALRLTGKESRLSISNSHLLVTLFPQLEELYLHLQWTDWTLASIDDFLTEHEKTAKTRHPLKKLSITTPNSSSLLILSSILLSRLLAVETLMVGSLSAFRSHFETMYHGPASVSRFLVELSEDALSYAWGNLMNTLTHLDIHTTVLANKDITASFFERLQELRHLRALCVSTKHIHDWTPVTFSAPESAWEGLLPSIKGSAKNRGNNNSGLCNESTNMRLPAVDISFPLLQDFVVKSSRFGTHKIVTASQVIFVLATAPALEHFVLEDGSVDENTLSDLKGAFPKQFMPLSKKDLAWIETVHGY